MTKLEQLLEWMDDAEYAPSYGELRKKVKELIAEEQQVKSVDLDDVGGSLLIDKLVKDLGDTNRKFTIWHDGGEWLISIEPNSMRNCKTLKEWIEQ